MVGMMCYCAEQCLDKLHEVGLCDWTLFVCRQEGTSKRNLVNSLLFCCQILCCWLIFEYRLDASLHVTPKRRSHSRSGQLRCQMIGMLEEEYKRWCCIEQPMVQK